MKKHTLLTPPTELRKRAEKMEKISTKAFNSSPLSAENFQSTLHELRVHQIELEMQNEELRHIQEELDKSRERYFDLYDMAPVGYCTISENGIILESNLTISSMIGVARRYVTKMPFSKFIREEDLQSYYKFRKSLANTQKAQECEVRMVHSDKSSFWVKLSATLSHENENLSYRIVLTDITELKNAQQAIISMNDELENKIMLRTTDLVNSSNAMKSFSYTVSHDLRSPLRAIDGFSAILSSTFKDQLGSEGQRLLQVIRSNAMRMNQLIIDLLELAKATNSDIKKRKIDMNQLVNTVYQEHVCEEDRKRTTLTVTKLIDGFGDPNLIAQVWANLLTNSVKFSRKKDNPTLVIESHREGDQIIYSLKDNGCGFNPAYQNKLFVAFQRLCNEEEFEGTGIGLVLVHRIVQKHGGKAWAEGAEGTGATFYFSMLIEGGD